jgi:hypothetical protein
MQYKEYTTEILAMDDGIKIRKTRQKNKPPNAGNLM